ncbi:glucosyltransferase-I [Haliangium sp.]|uniref:glucosyltransferase-I n=1 Tax=Haliangium sp. TaxID=2663208 RepID=UPI003D124A45
MWSRYDERRTVLAVMIGCGLATLAISCLDKPAVVMCSGSSGCPAGYECHQGQCIEPGVCGNGKVEDGEECDGDDPTADYRCNSTCKKEFCGNGVREASEDCDCGSGEYAPEDTACRGRQNDAGGGYCRRDCRLHCGDGEVAGEEVCDPGAALAQSCADERYDFGALACAASCDALIYDQCGLWGWQLMESGTGEHLEAVWAAGPNDIFAVGWDHILHNDGTGWSPVAAPYAWALRDIWGTSGDDYFVVGYEGLIMHYDGAEWNVVESSVWDRSNSYPTANLRAVWGSGPNDVYVVGDGVVLHYDGVEWAAVFDDSPYRFNAVWGSGADHVFVVGDMYTGAEGDTYFSPGVILHYDGERWSEALFEPGLGGVWGSGPDDVFAVGDEGRILHYDGYVWSNMDSGVSDILNSLYAVWGSGPNDVFAVGLWGMMLHYDGRYWSRLPTLTTNSWWGVGGVDAHDVFAVGWNGTIGHLDAMWSELDSGTSLQLNAAWGHGPNDVVVVGQLGEIRRYDGREWRLEHSHDGWLFGVWGAGPSDIFAVGTGVLHYDGAAWTRMDVGEGFWDDVWGTRPNDVFAVGSWGQVAHYDGAEWTENFVLGAEARVDLSGVWGSASDDVFAVGHVTFEHGGVILHYDGEEWRPMNPNVAEAAFLDVWGTGPDDVYVVGFRGDDHFDFVGPGTVGLILHYDGATWSERASFSGTRLQAIWGSGKDDIFAAGAAGKTFHFDGSTWQRIRTGTAEVSFEGIWGLPGRRVFFVGQRGVIYQRH